MNWRALLAILGLVGVCLLCMAALERVSKALRERNPVALPKFDYLLDGVEMVRQRAESPGILKVSASRIVHHREADLLEVHLPVLQRLGIPDEQLSARAARATVHKGNNQVDLNGGVQLERKGPQRNMLLTTEYLVVLIEAQTAATDAPVEIRQGASILRGRGLEADLRAANYKILSSLEARYVPVPRTTARAVPAAPAEPVVVASTGAQD